MAIAAAWVGGIIGLAEGLSRAGKIGPEAVRKIVHIGTGNIIVLALLLQMSRSLALGASLLFCLVTLVSYWLPILPGINSVGRKSLGTFFYALSFVLLIACCWSDRPHLTVLGILVMTWGDGLAALIGQRWGRHPYQLWGIQKSWEGSAAMAIASFSVCVLVLLVAQPAGASPWLVAAAVAIVATALEAFSKYGIDNLTVPLGSAIVAALLA